MDLVATEVFIMRYYYTPYTNGKVENRLDFEPITEDPFMSRLSLGVSYKVFVVSIVEEIDHPW